LWRTSSRFAAQGRLAVELVGDADAGSEVLPVRVDDVSRDAVLAGDQHPTLVGIEHRQLVGRAEEGRSVVVADAEVQRQLVVDLPVVLHEGRVLPVVQDGAAEAAPQVAEARTAEEQ